MYNVSLTSGIYHLEFRVVS